MHTQTHTDPHLTLSLALFLSLPPSLPPSLPRCLSLPLSLSLSLSPSLSRCLCFCLRLCLSLSLSLPSTLFLFSSDAARDGRHLGNSFINATCSQIFQNASYARTEDPNTGLLRPKPRDPHLQPAEGSCQSRGGLCARLRSKASNRTACWFVGLFGGSGGLGV